MSNNIVIVAGEPYSVFLEILFKSIKYKRIKKDNDQYIFLVLSSYSIFLHVLPSHISNSRISNFIPCNSSGFPLG